VRFDADNRRIASAMDINSLLSPQDSPATETPPPLPQVATQSPKKRTRRQIPSRTPSNISQHSQHPTSSPQRFHPETLPTHVAPVYQQHQQHHHTPVASYTNGRGVHSATHTPPAFDNRQFAQTHDPRVTPPHPLHRQASTPGMDALADLASMQHVQQAARQQNVAQRPSIR
jgi:hypothetical protein